MRMQSEKTLSRFALRDFLCDGGNLVDVEWLRNYPIGIHRISRLDANRVRPTADDRERHRFRPLTNLSY
jgi:hypothetical protein